MAEAGRVGGSDPWRLDRLHHGQVMRLISTPACRARGEGRFDRSTARLSTRTELAFRSRRRLGALSSPAPLTIARRLVLDWRSARCLRLKIVAVKMRGLGAQALAFKGGAAITKQQLAVEVE